MPTVLRLGGYRFLVYLHEHEPAHVHVVSGDGEAKILLDPVQVRVDWGYDRREARLLRDLALEHLEELKNAWHFHHGAEAGASEGSEV